MVTLPHDQRFGAVQRDLRNKFLEICRAQDKPAAQIIREFMRAYVDSHEGVRSDSPREAKQNSKTRGSKPMSIETRFDVPLVAGFRETKRAERIPGFDQAPDFITPDEFMPVALIEAKLTEDGGTARDKVARVQRLSTLRDEQGKDYDVIACIAGRGFKVRREDMRRLLQATDGKVFTLATMHLLIENTRIREYRVR
jgi:hypothetical protein